MEEENVHVVHVPVFVAGATTTMLFKSREYVNPAFIKSYIKLSLGSATWKQREGKWRKGKEDWTLPARGMKATERRQAFGTSYQRLWPYTKIRGTREKERKQATSKARLRVSFSCDCSTILRTGRMCTPILLGTFCSTKMGSFALTHAPPALW